MNLEMLRRLAEEKVSYTFSLYKSTLEEIRKISEDEGVKLANIVRLSINEFIEKYRTEVKKK